MLFRSTAKTKGVLDRFNELYQEETKKHVLDIDVDHTSGIDNFDAGYICPSDDVIVGLQTDAPFKRIVNPYGGLRMVKQALDAYSYTLNPTIEKHFSAYRKTHNQGVFDAYTPSIKKARHAGLLTGLPDAYGRGRIIGDYRRVALYGTAFLMEEKKRAFETMYLDEMDETTIRTREEISMQYKALEEMNRMAYRYGFDIKLPARNAKEAIQWTYFAYLAAVKENNGAAMSLGRVEDRKSTRLNSSHA